MLPTEVPRVYEEAMSYQDPLVVQTEETISLGGSENHYELLTVGGNEEKSYQELSVLPAEGTRVYEAPSLPDGEQEVYHEPQALPTGGQGLGKGLKLYQEATVEGGQVEIKGTESKIMESMVDEAAYYQYGNKGTVPIAVECMNEPIYYKEGPRVLPAGEPELGGGSKSYQESSVTGGTKYEIKGTQSKVVDWMGDKYN